MQKLKNKIKYFKHQLKIFENIDTYKMKCDNLKKHIAKLEQNLFEKKQQKIKLWENINRSNMESLTYNLMQIYYSEINFSITLIYKVKNAIKQQKINNLKRDVYNDTKI